jgi:hypothetical protein
MWTMDDDTDWGLLLTCLPERSGSPQYWLVSCQQTSLTAASNVWFLAVREVSGVGGGRRK